MPAMAAGFPSETAVQFAAHLHVRGYLSYLLLQPGAAPNYNTFAAGQGDRGCIELERAEDTARTSGCTSRV